MMDPSRTAANLPVVETIKGAVEKAYQQPPIMQPSMGGSLPDYVWTKILNTPSVVVPYANFDEANHSPNENVGLENFFEDRKSTRLNSSHVAISYVVFCLITK